ncbi:MAG: transporter substrate-binding domain-containing protein [Burkholderiales bacterium]|nr:transporter substrate-binding domain-containing protein [Burkholderiales bacterium]
MHTVRPLLCLLLSCLAQAATILYPRPESADDVRGSYALRLLQLGLNKSGGNYELKPTALVMDQGRALVQLERGGGDIDIVWSSTSIEREAKLLPIRIPIYKGLIGWRLALIRSDRPDLLSRVKNLKDLQAYTAIQEHDWPDTAILRANGLPVLTDYAYRTLFKLLASSDADTYFPRSVVEIWDEAAAHHKENLVVDPYIALHYPSVSYFFVNPKNTALADAVRVGLEKAIADGSFDRLFAEQYASVLAKAQLDRRVVIELRNPTLPPQTPLGRRELWFNPLDSARSPK